MHTQDELSKLGVIARRLHAGADRLDQTLTRIDAALQALHLNIEYTHPRPVCERTTRDGKGKRVIEISFLGLLRLGQRHGLAIKTVKVLESRRAAATEQPGRVSPLLVAPRPIRHAAVDILPALVSGVTSEMSAIIEHLSRRSDVADKLLVQLVAASEPTVGMPPKTRASPLRLASGRDSSSAPGARAPSQP